MYEASIGGQKFDYTEFEQRLLLKIHDYELKALNTIDDTNYLYLF